MDDERRLEERSSLSTRNGICQTRVVIGNRRYRRKNLKTSSEADAKRAEFKQFHQTEYKPEEGLSVQPPAGWATTLPQRSWRPRRRAAYCLQPKLARWARVATHSAR